MLEAATVLGTDLVIVPAGIPHDQFTDRDGLAYHNHWWEIEPRVDGEHALEGLARRLDRRVLLQVDTYWVTALDGA